MSDTTLPANVTAEIDDKAVERFFESGGEEIVEVKALEKTAEQETPKEQQQSQIEDQQQPPEQKQRMVEYGALHEERERRKELQRQLQEQQQRYEQALQRVLERVLPAQQPQVPSFEEDPLNNANYRLQTLEERIAQKDQHEEQQRKQWEYVQAEQRLVNRYKQDALTYIQQNPEFTNAYQYLVTERLKEYQAAGYTPDEANALLLEDEKATIARAYQEGVNPAERIFNLAKVRGFNVQSAQSAPEQNSTKQNEEKLNRMQKGLAEGKSLNNISGKAESTDITLDTLASMSNEELDEFISNPKSWSKLGKLMQ